MKTKIITQLEQLKLGRFFFDCIEYQTFSFLGIFWKKEIEYYFDMTNGDFIAKYN